MVERRNKGASFGAVMAIYLLGLVVGGLYVGMVAPVRTVIQAEFGIGNGQGIWIITIYALFYASFIPVVGKLADRAGRKPVFVACMGTFCIGAATCGASEWILGLPSLGQGAAYIVLLAGRVLQAIGACGIIPLANAEIGTSAPPEKRGFALGITAAASGLSNVLGAGVGSGIIGIVGQSRWPVLFFACIPFGVLAVVAGIAKLPESEPRNTGRMDIAGSVAVVLLVLLLLLGIQLASDSGGVSSVQGTESGDVSYAVDAPPEGAFPWDVVLAFCGAAACLVAFVAAERRAQDPVLSPAYFKDKDIVVTLAASFLIGGMINAMTLVPEFAEVSLGMPAGSGGVYMMVIGVFSLAGPPLGGKLIDRFGPKPVLMGGSAVAACGFLLLAVLTAMHPSVATMVAGLAVMGMGLGFCMGAPVNYMMLANVPENESNSAISAATLVRQVGLSIAPAIYVAFITPGIGSQGYASMFVVAGAFAAFTAALMVAYRGRRESK